GYFTITPGTEELIGGYGNAIWGDWYMIDYANNFAQGDTLVHVESLDGRIIIIGGQGRVPTPAENAAAVRELMSRAPEAADDVYIGYGGASFWGRCATIFEGATKRAVDFREPLASTFAARFYQNAAFSGGTDYLVWRDSLFNVYLGDGSGGDYGENGFRC